MKQHSFLLIVLLVLGLASATRAELLFSTLGQLGTQSVGFDSEEVQYATDFLTDATPRSITSLTVRMANTSAVIPLTVSFGIYTDNGSGVPDALHGAFATTVLLPVDSVGEYTATSPGINLQANTAYWVVGQLVAPQSLGTASWRYDEGQGTDGGPFTTVATTPIQRFGGVLWSSVGDGNLIYALEGTPIPEPSTLPVLLTAGAFGAIGWWRRRRVARGNLRDCGSTN